MSAPATWSSYAICASLSYVTPPEQALSGSGPSKARSLFWVGLCYLLCFVVGWLWLTMGPKSGWPMLDALIADLWMTLVIFIFSRAFGNSSFYDSAWSLVPAFFVGYWWTVQADGADPLRMGLMALVVAAWSIRLTMNWILHWPGLHEEDWRYAMLRGKAPKLEFLIDFFLIHFFPTIQVFLGMLPIFAVFCLPNRPFELLDGIAFAVGMAAVLIEMVADIQLHRFIKQRQPGQLLDKGLWAYSRHPNYFGEFMFWVSLALFGLAALPGQWWWQVLGAVAILLMFVTASIPMMEKKVAGRPGHEELKRRVSVFVPWPPKKLTDSSASPRS